MIRDDLNRKKIALVCATNLIMFFFLVLFFTKIAPLIVYNCDDWIYLGEIRLPIPLWGSWNPTRVFFETIMPICGRIAGYVVYPITRDFVKSVTIVSAFLLSALITIMCICFYKLMRERFGKTELQALFLELFFIAMFFMIFRTRSESSYMFCAEDLCCVFNYIMPGVLNAIVVLVMARYQNFSDSFKSFSVAKKCAFIILLYFALLSNIFHSVITISYCVAKILRRLIVNCTSKEKTLGKLIYEARIELIIVCAWLVVLVFEKSGGRAGDFETGLDIVRTLLQFKAIMFAVSIPFIIIVVESIVYTVISILEKSEIRPLVLELLVGLAITFVFLFLLNSKVGYMSRVDATWGIWFYLILLCSIVFSELQSRMNLRSGVSVGLLLLIFFLCYYPDGKYMISSSRNRNYELCYKTSSYYEQSIIAADKEGKDTLYIKIPEVEVYNGTNLTFYPGFGDAVSKTLYLNGIIDNVIVVVEQADPSLNEEFLGVD
ncbi:hypothetical protein [Butyrivibrio sp. INlla18]|uniref:hypothetical protein n=1 Tax=Butyrivibrio sp. INlla18 TaxID=1520806 RepID=UPI00115FC762|nr:hypothetical protein [Butyrivibrio sp. INlla18]